MKYEFELLELPLSTGQQMLPDPLYVDPREIVALQQNYSDLRRWKTSTIFIILRNGRRLVFRGSMEYLISAITRWYEKT